MQLLATGVMGPGERLQLVGRRGGPSETGVFGLRIDLLDAFSESAPKIEPVLDPEQIRADVIVVVAGQTPSDDPSVATTRDTVAATNLRIFEQYAQVLAKHSRGHELCLIQSNPVELAVDVFSRHLGAHRVVGAGSYSDTLRLRREFADGLLAFGGELAHRPIVSGYMLGEHGPGIVPIWSSLRAYGVDADTWSRYLRHARGGRQIGDLNAHATAARGRLSELLAAHQGEEAFMFVTQLPPDVRAIVKPWFAHWSGRTSTVTAHSVVDLISELRSGHRVLLPLQVAFGAQDWPGGGGVLGLPVDIDLEGWHRTVPLDLAPDEEAALEASRIATRRSLDAWQASGD